MEQDKPVNGGGRMLPRSQQFRLATASRRGFHDPTANWWMITLSDLTILLLGFAVLWHTSSKSTTTQSARAAVVAAAAPAATQPAVVEGAVSPETLHDVQQDLASFVMATGLRQDVTIESAPGEILLSMRDSVPFESGKADLRPRALPVLEKIAQVVLANSEMAVAISGHTDSKRIENPAFPSNWELSTARASRVARYLIQRGLRPSRIAVQGFADHRPKKPNSNPNNRRANRRVEIRLFVDKSSG